MLLSLPPWVAPGSAATWNDGTDTLTVSGAASIVGDPSADNAIVNVSGSGSHLTFEVSAGPAPHLAELNLSSNATVVVASAGAGPAATNRALFVDGADGLSIDSTSNLALEDNGLVIDYGPLETTPIDDIEDLIIDGFNAGDWLGDGIASSTAEADPFTYAIGIGENVNLPIPYGDGSTGPLLAGAEVDDTAVVVKVTYVGDVTLDGAIEFQDLSIFNGNYDNGATSGRHWVEGDLNYDGYIEFQDLSVFNGNYPITPPATPANVTATPITASRIDLDWDTVSGSGLTYSVYRSTSEYFVLDETTLVADEISASAYSDTSVIGDTTYYYAVVTVDDPLTSGIGYSGDVTTAAEQTVSAIDDAYVRDGTHASSNFGTSTQLQLKDDATVDNERDAYLMFDTSDFNGAVESATLRLYGSYGVSGTVPVAARGSWISWDEGTITWNNRPTPGATELDTTNVTATAQWYEWDLTDYVRAARVNGQEVIAVMLEPTTATASEVTFNSDEAASNKPQLVLDIDTDPPPPPPPATILGTIDAHVRDGTHASTNYGQEEILEVNLGSTNDARRTFVRFDVPQEGCIESASIRMLGWLDSSGTDQSVAAYPVSNITWDEDTITWNNQPSYTNTVLDTETISGIGPAWYEWDVTAYLEAEQTLGHTEVTFMLADATSGGPLVEFASSESGAGPRLAIDAVIANPTNLVIGASDSQVELTWDAVPGATGYDIYVSSTPGGPADTLLASNVGTTTYIDTTATPGDDTTYQVLARLNGCTSIPSDNPVDNSKEGGGTITVPHGPGFVRYSGAYLLFAMQGRVTQWFGNPQFPFEPSFTGAFDSFSGSIPVPDFDPVLWGGTFTNATTSLSAQYLVTAMTPDGEDPEMWIDGAFTVNLGTASISDHGDLYKEDQTSFLASSDGDTDTGTASSSGNAVSISTFGEARLYVAPDREDHLWFTMQLGGRWQLTYNFA